MNSLFFKNKTSNNEMDKIINENNEAIIPIENKRIVFPSNFKNSLLKNTLTNISPLNVKHSNVLITNSKTSSNIFSPRKKKIELKNKQDTHRRNVSAKNKEKQKYSKNILTRNMELFNNSNFETQINDKNIKKIFFERNYHCKYSNLKNISMGGVNEIPENYYYSTNYMIKDKDLKKFQDKNVSEIRSKINNINNLYSNKKIINYNSIFFIEHNNIGNSDRIYHEYNKKLKNAKWMMEDNMNNKMKTSQDLSIIMDKKLNKDSIPYINYENELKSIKSLSLKDIDTKVKGSGTNQANEVVGSSKQYFSIFDDINPVISKKIKKGKKKNMGACFFNLNDFSCQFLMSCDKT